MIDLLSPLEGNSESLQVEDAQGRLVGLLREAGLEPGHLEPRPAWTVFGRFMELPVQAEEDALLFQYGMYSFSGPQRFLVSFCRQFDIDRDGAPALSGRSSLLTGRWRVRSARRMPADPSDLGATSDVTWGYAPAIRFVAGECSWGRSVSSRSLCCSPFSGSGSRSWSAWCWPSSRFPSVSERT